MCALATEKPSETVGVKILGVDAERLVADEDLPVQCLERDNTGLVHRACEFDRSLPRRMHRSTLVGQEPIQ